MISRTYSKRLEAALALSSRQALPRPARLSRPYSSPTKRASAPALAAAHAPSSASYPAYMPAQADVDQSRLTRDMQSFLRRPIQYTLLPTPLPDDSQSAENSMYFSDSSTQDQLSVMDACLHNLQDVHRAKSVFERLRTKSTQVPLEPKIYDAFLEAYLELADREDSQRSIWMDEAWALFEVMESGAEKVIPTKTTYATMLLAWHRFNPESEKPLEWEPSYNVSKLLERIVERQISITEIMADQVMTSSTEVASLITLVSQAAVQLGYTHVVHELGQAEALGRTVVDEGDAIPEARPVLKEIKQVKRSDETQEEFASRQPEYEVPFNLLNLRKHLAQVALARRVLPEDVVSRQKLLEESVYEVASERWKHVSEQMQELGVGADGLRSRELQQWMWEWHQKLVVRLTQEIKDVAAAEETKKLHGSTVHLAPLLSLVRPEKLSLITILELMRLNGSGGLHDGMKTARALISVGRAVELEYKAQMCRKNQIQLPSQPRPGEQSYFTRMGYSNLQARRVAAAKYVADAEEWTADWSQHTRVKIGSILVNCLMETAFVTRTAINKKTGEEVSEEQPAFFHTYEYVRGQKLGVLRLNQVVLDRIAKDSVGGNVHPRHLPMLVKPKPWISHNQGGYIYNKTSAMRFKDSVEQQIYLSQASEKGNVELVFAGLDVLGSTPWQINRQIFDVVLQVWNSGDRMGKIPPAVYDESEPVPPPMHEVDQRAKSIWIQRQKAYANAKSNNHSERCSVNYKIEIARTFLNDTFYLPHNLDFRGRAYPIPPHLNHVGDDLSRGLLKFGESKPLGERGMRWLKIHLANLYGFDKGSFDERVQFVEDHLEDIKDSATKPLEGNQWWLNADDPWQCLATCMELNAALESPNPYEFESNLPVHQDGTCNGLQHYAALGGDAKGAQQVNLSATDRPSDVYTFVADMVEADLLEAKAKGEKYAVMLSGKIARKVVKQTVMTTVYGVTFIGARDQIERQLKDKKIVPEEEAWGAAAYLAKKVLTSIGNLFSGAKGIQTWLNLCARLITKSIPPERLTEATQIIRSKKGAKSRLQKEQMTSMVWTTPLGLPIVQPYRKTKRKQVMTALQTVFISDPNSPAEVNSIKQASAFPPNFIHSLDATHMMLTALACRSSNITFASVHDSYWTHACSIDEMSSIIRNTFIALHSSDVLIRLDEEFRERYKDYKVPLSSLKTSSLAKQLASAGTRIVLPNDIMPALQGLAGVESVGDDGASSAVTEAEGIDEILAEVAEEASGESDEPVDPSLVGKFVNLTDLIPPLPKKGDFNVQEIKQSPYFFS